MVGLFLDELVDFPEASVVSHALVTIISTIPQERVDEARRLVEALGNPASGAVHAAFESLAAEPGELAVHFASITVFPATGGGGHLVFEFSADGTEDALIRVLAERLGPYVGPAFDMAVDRGTSQLHRYWASHTVKVGHGFFDNPGVLFAGTPGLSVRRIRAERALRDRLADLVDEQGSSDCTALARLEAVRSRLSADPNFSWARQPEDAAALHSERSILEALRKIVPEVTKTYLWPLAVPPLLVFLIVLAVDFSPTGFSRALMAGFVAGIAGVSIAIVLGLVAYLIFRRMENSDVPDDRAPDPRAVARIVERENHAAQSHLGGVSVMKPGLLRKLAVRLVFAAVAQLATHLFRPGWLGTLGTIHFARWVMVPGTGDLVFLSNYGGSWESYLEDFITKAHDGLTGVWSNTQGFPKTANLVQFGASDGDRFKRWARRQQVPTGCWYTAYPDLTTTHIRTNAAIRQGLGAILTEEEATRWLSLFGSQPRPASSMEVNKIQSLAFGGLGFLRYGTCVGFSLENDRASARAWLREVLADVAFGDGRKHGDRAIILALAASALETLQLPSDSLATFPPAFLDGMCSASRSRILGDEHRNAPEHWEWGGPQRTVDGLLLLFAPSEEKLAKLRADMERCLTSRGHAAVMDVPFVTLPDKDATAEEHRLAKLEPFGFVDGVSQPVIRGTYKALRGADPIHLVEPGEFILGYPDNRGNLPAGPTLAAVEDPGNMLPIAASPQHGFARAIVNDPRDVGRNGSFLCVRQLEQDVRGFWDYCTEAAAQIQQRFPNWIDVNAEFVGAKLVGRWQDGSSLVRFPYRAGSEEAGAEHPMVRTAQGTATASEQAAPPPPVAPSHTHKTPASGAARTTRVKVRRTNAAVREVTITPDNDFLFGAEDPQGLRCPFGAHIRRTNPRESLDPASQEQVAITNRHRILRLGRRYVPESGRNPGLFFMCLNADIERQFEFIQQTWAQASSFHGLMHERDPLLGSRDGNDAAAHRPDDGYTIPTRDGPVRLCAMPEFVRTLGGGYFFVPGKSLLEYLAS